jgi:hypothetical protein
LFFKAQAKRSDVLKELAGGKPELLDAPVIPVA